jgi:hypothetical protein
VRACVCVAWSLVLSPLSYLTCIEIWIEGLFSPQSSSMNSPQEKKDKKKKKERHARKKAEEDDDEEDPTVVRKRIRVRRRSRLTLMKTYVNG